MPENSPDTPELNPSSKENENKEEPQPVWTFRGYQLGGSEFTTAMVHLFRAEVQRANVWRQRLDATTNWAVITTGALLTFIFGSTDSPSLVILINLLLVTIFLIIEARRYRYYELWSYRVRLMETDFFASMLIPPFHPSPEWAEALAEHLLHPQFPISNLEAFGRRLRRNYLWIYIVITLAWLTHIWLKPIQVKNWEQLIKNASFQGVIGEVVLGILLAFFIIIVLIAILTARLQHSAGEVHPRFPGISMPLSTSEKVNPEGDHHAWFRPAYRRQQLMTLIITDKPQEISDLVLKDMRRGMTAISGTGMYTGKTHSILLCALTVTEIPQLRHLVSQIDKKAFVIVSPAQEIYGSGFMPLNDSEE
jgi:uncharacterized membrane protein